MLTDEQSAELLRMKVKFGWTVVVGRGSLRGGCG